MTAPRRVLVTGASGYVGGLLVPALLDKGYAVRVLARSADRLRSRPWHDQVEIVEGDATRTADLDRALDGVVVAYYLLHSMDGDGDFAERDAELARGFSAAARAAGVQRIVYLGGLHPEGELSPHLASRAEVGQILLDSGVPTAALQAGVVLGAGSASFDMLRHLAERLPVMVAPRWLESRIQPIAVRDALYYLVAAAELPSTVNRTFDIGGPEVLKYGEMLTRYAALTGLGRRVILTVPVLTPRLASHWVGLVTPVPAGLARPLVDSLVHDAVQGEDDLAELVGEPPGGRMGFDAAIRAATAALDPTAWRRTLRRTAAAVTATAVAGGLLTDPNSAWYRSLKKPSWQPPPAAFGPVWTALYADVAVASAIALTELPKDRQRSYATAFATNLVLNAGWSGLFFRAKNPRLATAGAAVLAASSADLARRAGAVRAAPAVGLGAYAAWCGFATALSAAIARRNPRA